MFQNVCCEKSIRSYDEEDDLGSFDVLSGRDAVDETLFIKCRDCEDEWSRTYQGGGTLIWTKTKEVFQPS